MIMKILGLMVVCLGEIELCFFLIMCGLGGWFLLWCFFLLLCFWWLKLVLWNSKNWLFMVIGIFCFMSFCKMVSCKGWWLICCVWFFNGWGGSWKLFLVNGMYFRRLCWLGVDMFFWLWLFWRSGWSYMILVMKFFGWFFCCLFLLKDWMDWMVWIW